MSFITNNQLLQAIADRLKLASTSELPAYWSSTIGPDANTAAYQEIVGQLLARGYSKSQVDAWDRGAEFQKSIGLFFALSNAGVYAGYDPETIENLDRREELERVIVTVSGEWVKPTGDKPGLITTAGPSAEGGIFNFPDPNGEELGRYTHW